MRRTEFEGRLEQLATEFNKDFDLTRLDEVGRMQAKVPYLHSKYLKLEMLEGDTLKRMENALKTVESENSDWYLGRASDEFTAKKGVFPILISKNSEGPPKKGKVLNAELGRYLDADKDVQNARLAVNRQKEIVRFLHEKVSTLAYMNNTIGNIIRWELRANNMPTTD